MPETVLNLAGEWEFAFGEGPEPPRAGGRAHITLPGSTDEAGLGEETTQAVRWHLSRKHRFVGPACYSREIGIPGDFAGKTLTLFLERCHWATRLWVDGEPAGERESLCAPHLYDLTGLAPGRHRLTLCVDNRLRYDVGRLAHSVTEHTQTNWNGVIGRIELRARDPVHIGAVQVYPDPEAKTARVRVMLRNGTGGRVEGTLALAVRGETPVPACPPLPFASEQETFSCETLLPMGEAPLLWDEFTPALYTLEARLVARAAGGEKAACADERRVSFGLRRFAAEGTHFTLNGRPVFLRGTLDCCVFPRTGHPPMQEEAWAKIFATVRDYGFNHIRFHSWCPPEAAFAAADRAGLLLQAETPVWTRLGSDPALDAFVTAEGDRILRSYGNHPSFCMLAVGNEPAGPEKDRFLAETVKRWKESDPRRLYTGCSGWPELPVNDYHVLKNAKTVLRCQDWLDELNGRLNARPFSTDSDYAASIAGIGKPVVAHEVGQWCAFPDFRFPAKLDGPLEARNYGLFARALKDKGLWGLREDFLRASGRLQVGEYKEDIEAALRTPGFGGFQLLSAQDFSGQGTALVGFLDSLWESKGYTDPAEFRRFCCETVPLARMEKAVWERDETFRARVEFAHFGPRPFEDAAADWSLAAENGETVAEGAFTGLHIPTGNGIGAGELAAPLAGVKAPARLTLTVSLRGTPYRNDWHIWVYPKTADASLAGVTVCTDTAAAEKALAAGGRVLLFPLAEIAGHIPAGYTSVFWNYEFTSRQAPRTLGILCDPADPCLRDFPTGCHSDWQWQEIVKDAKPVVIDTVREKVRPVVRMIDDWNTCDALALLFEARCGGGRLMVCGADLPADPAGRSAARQLLRSILRYMASSAFDPREEVTPEALRRALADPGDDCPDRIDMSALVHQD